MPATDPAVRLLTLAERQDAVLTRRQVLASGLGVHVLRRRLEVGEWTPLLRGSYLVEPGCTGTALQRAWARSAALVVPGAVLAMGAAAALHGVEGVPRRRAVDVVVRNGLRERPGLVPHRWPLADDEVVDLGGIPTTSVARTLADLVPVLPRPDALAVLDSALARRLISAEALTTARAGAQRRPGCRDVADLWALADARAESALESRARLRCIDAGLPPDDLQREVRDEHGHVLARADMVFERRTRRGALPLLLEADGAEHHDSPRALHRDRWRHNALVALGYETVRCTWADTLSRGAVPAMVRRAL